MAYYFKILKLYNIVIIYIYIYMHLFFRINCTYYI